jgi:hypothetical protein
MRLATRLATAAAAAPVSMDETAFIVFVHVYKADKTLLSFCACLFPCSALVRPCAVQNGRSAGEGSSTVYTGVGCVTSLLLFMGRRFLNT